MLPLDIRLGEEFDGIGIDYLVKNVRVHHVFPMHLWKKFEAIDRYRAVHPDQAEQIVRIHADGESFSI